MAYSYVRYTGNGSTQNYTFSFPYINQDHIKVRVNGVITTAWSFLNSSTVQFTSAPANGAILDIRRETPKDSAIVNFTDGSVLLERDLDLLATYDLYLAQETKDGLDASITQTSLGVFDGQSKRITNVADPVNAQDAVTKVYADAIIAQSAAAATAAGAVQVALAASEADDSAASALASAASATAAAGSATASANSASAAAASYDSFDDRYLGAKAVAPTVDNDGNALMTGAVFWDTVSSQMFVWSGSQWKPTFLTGNAVRSLITATAGQTVFTVPTYVVAANTLQVFVNGIKVLVSSDYTETNQNTITFGAGLSAGDEVEVIALQPYAIGTTGAESVSFQQAGSGSTLRNVSDKLKEFVSVKDFGAVGDGVTDDTTAIQAALTASLQVCFDGSYKISAPLILRSGHSLRSTNKRARIVRNTSVTPFDMVVGVSVTDITIDNLQFDGVAKTTVTVAANRYCAIRLWDNNTGVQCKRVAIKNCRFDKTTSAEIQAEGVRGVIALEQCSDVEISNCQFYDNRATCIFWYDNTDNVRVSDCYCLGEQTPYDPTFQRVGSFTSGDRILGASVSNCRIIGTGYTSINISGDGVSVSGCVIQSPAYSGITISENAPASTSVTITGCSVRSPGYDGVSVFELDGGAISGCTFSGATTSSRAGIRFIGPTSGNAAKNVLISGCNFLSNAIGINLNHGQNIVATGNFFKGNGSGVFVKNDSVGNAATLTCNGNTFIDQTSIALELNSLATVAQTVYVSSNIFVSTNISTLQRYGVISSGSISTVTLGTNSFSSNYDVSAVSGTFTAGKGLLTLSSGVMNELSVVSGLPLLSAWFAKHFKMGTYEFWVDSTGDLRIKNGVPTSDTDGTVVGTQT